jgi:hypothetical protein
MPKVKKLVVTVFNKKVKGKINVSGRTVKFEIDKNKNHWEQWGAPAEILCQTQEFVEKMADKFLIGEDII